MAVRLVFFGPPASGKGTHAAIAAENMGIPKISTGDMLRENVKKGTELGKEAKGYMDSGGLVPDELVIGMLKERISEPDCEKGFILDGFPRTVPQAEELGKITEIDLVVNFKASQEVLIQRMSGRRTCRSCDEIYHVTNMPPKKEGVCDKCGGELFQRKDDTVDVVKKRLDAYEKQTSPLEDYYRKKGNLTDVDVEGEIPEVSARILKLLKEKVNI
jgi:adenylate kinase